MSLFIYSLLFTTFLSFLTTIYMFFYNFVIQQFIF